MAGLHAKYYADRLVQVDTVIEQNELIAEGTYRLRIAAPGIAGRVLPGQFVMIRLSGINAPLIGRAFAVYDVILDEQGEAHWLDLVYIRKGALTRVLATATPGTGVTLWGPLGNAFRTTPCDRLILAAGGIGQTPMLMAGREALGRRHYASPDRESGWSRSVELIYGARRAALLAGLDDFRGAGFDLQLCTDDGSAGIAKRVPDVLAERLAELPEAERIRVITCGPEIMMQRVAEICLRRGVDCQVSMETPMACGIGICFSCVAKVQQRGESDWDYKRTCVEGPIFDAEVIRW